MQLVCVIITVSAGWFVATYAWIAHEVHWEWRSVTETRIFAAVSCGLLFVLTACAMFSIEHLTSAMVWIEPFCIF